MPPEAITELVKLGFPGIVILVLVWACHKLYSERLEDWQKNADLNIKTAVALAESTEALKSSQALIATLSRSLDDQTKQLDRLINVNLGLDTLCKQMREDMLRGTKSA